MANRQTAFSQLFPSLPDDFREPFWYASLQSFWLYYRVAPEAIAERLPALPEDEGLEVALFDFGDGDLADWRRSTCSATPGTARSTWRRRTRSSSTSTSTRRRACPTCR
jgi:hypothetical protein